MTENEDIERLDRDTSLMKIHIAKIKNENPMDHINSAIRIAIEAIVVARQYREIGTVEECRAAVKRMKPRKVANYELGVDKYGNCPNCDTSYQLERNEVINYCPNCGQAIDWSEENE